MSHLLSNNIFLINGEYTCYDFKKRRNDKFTCNICFMDVPIRYKKRHFKKIWHEKLEKYTNDLIVVHLTSSCVIWAFFGMSGPV
jgi:hypothetical protein